MKKKRGISYRDLAREANAPAPTPQAEPVPEPEQEMSAPEIPVESAPVAELDESGHVATHDGVRQHLVVRVGRELFAMPLDSVDEALDFGELHALPEMGETMLGVFSLRGALVSLFTPLGPLGVPLASGGAAIVFTVPGGRVAIAVDDVEDVLPIRPSELRRAPIDTSDGVLIGVVRRGRDLVGVVDPQALVTACRAEPVLEPV